MSIVCGYIYIYICIEWVGYRSIYSLNSALDGRWWSTPRPGSFTPGQDSLYQFYRNLSGPKGLSGQAQKSSPPQEFDPRSFQPVPSRYTDWANLALDIDTIQYYRRLLVTTGNSLRIVMSNASGFLGLSLWILSLINPLLKKTGCLKWCLVIVMTKIHARQCDDGRSPKRKLLLCLQDGQSPLLFKPLVPFVLF
jgi:hypothetical protein